MSDKEVAKKAFEQAENELRENQIAEVKEIVKKTLSAISKVDNDIDKLQEKKKYLKLDLEDLKEGRLDRIEERQEKDPKSKNYSLVIIIKERERVVERTPYWYVPYHVEWNQTVSPDTVYCTSGGTDNSALCSSFSSASSFAGTINGSITKDFAPGTYLVGDKIIHLR